jgi:hypothetical protein
MDTVESYEENLEEYRSKKYTYVPLPLDKKFVNTETGEIHELHPQQIIYPDATVYRAVSHLRGDPFLLVLHSHSFGTEDGELSCALGRSRFDETIGDLYATFSELPEQKELIMDLAEDTGIFEIITLADINRRATKESLYPIIAELESMFAEKIKQEFEGEGQLELIPYLGSETIERWGESKEDGLDMHVSEFMTLSEIQEVIANTEEIYNEYNFNSKSKFEDATGGLVEMRNEIMHVPRTLVHDEEDLHTLVDRVERCKEIVEEGGSEVKLSLYNRDPWYSDFAEIGSSR